jgi:hypothetical protein
VNNLTRDDYYEMQSKALFRAAFKDGAGQEAVVVANGKCHELTVPLTSIGLKGCKR